MTTKVVPGLLSAVANPAEAAREAASRMAKAIAKALSERGQAFIALSGGSTPKAAYALLADAPGLDWTKIHVFLVDERAGAADGDRSNFRMIDAALLTPAKVPRANVARLEGERADLDAAARAYEEALLKRVPTDGGAPVFDLIVFGIGADGHTASLFPGDGTVNLRDRHVIATPSREGREARLTLTAPVLEKTRAAVVIVLGAEKHAALERIWSATGDLEKTPGRVLRSIKGSIVWIIDHAAGGLSNAP
ncbi:MAG: 6-phosphogluconolactonase [Myxococcales bacterium]|nr:6-phosphogluconolactonase [Myxococcales bacterium]